MLAVDALEEEGQTVLVLFTTLPLDRARANAVLREEGLSALYMLRRVQRLAALPAGIGKGGLPGPEGPGHAGRTGQVAGSAGAGARGPAEVCTAPAVYRADGRARKGVPPAVSVSSIDCR